MTSSDIQAPSENSKQEGNASSTRSFMGNGNDAASDPEFTQKVIDATGPNASPRTRQVFSSLIKHLHAFALEVDLTLSEWMAGVDLINESGKFSTEARNETQLLCDILGLESLVDSITSAKLLRDTANGTGSLADAPTASAILGPFWRQNAPVLHNGSSIIQNDIPNGEYTFLHGTVRSLDRGDPIIGAEVDVWHTAPNGLYEQQDPDQPDMNLRGRFRTDENGQYALYCLRPTSYPIPYDGPAGKLLNLLDRGAMRPAHIHFIVTAPGHQPLTTQLYDSRDKHITDDAVFAVKDSLICNFLPREGDPKAQFQLEYDFTLTNL